MQPHPWVLGCRQIAGFDVAKAFDTGGHLRQRQGLGVVGSRQVLRNEMQGLQILGDKCAFTFSLFRVAKYVECSAA